MLLNNLTSPVFSCLNYIIRITLNYNNLTMSSQIDQTKPQSSSSISTQ
jgi:hypothetical protein